MMTLLVWFCAATMIAQACILGLSFLRGNLSKKSLVQIVALLNGIDIPGEKLKNAIAAGQEVPVPTREEILNARMESDLAFKSREESLKRFQVQLQVEQARLEAENAKLVQLRKEHEAVVAQFQSGRLDQTLKDVQDLLGIVPPEQAKRQILTMMNDGAIRDVVAIIKGMDEAVRKKILAEFTGDDDSAKLAEILKELRVEQPKPVSTPSSAAAGTGSDVN
jgi:hypothetical protein